MALDNTAWMLIDVVGDVDCRVEGVDCGLLRDLCASMASNAETESDQDDRCAKMR